MLAAGLLLALEVFASAEPVPDAGVVPSAAEPSTAEPSAAEQVAPAPAAPDVPPPAEAPRLRTVRRARQAFGTEVQMLATARTDEEAQLVGAHLDAAFQELRRVEAQLDPRRPESDVARVNGSAGGAPVVVEPEVFGVLAEAARLSSLSQGAFDPTFAALDGLWRFDKGAPAAGPRAPAAAALQEPLALVRFRDLLLDPAARTARLAREGQRIDLAGLAKGYALDRAALVLEERGVTGFLIAAGGDLVVRGTRGERPWQIGIQDPRAPGHFATLPVTKGAIMTTGDYERFFFEDGKRYHHVLDPRTGRPAEGLRSATVMADHGAEADALSTAVFVLGPEQGMALVERLRGVEAVLVTVDNRVLVSKGLKGVLRHRPPTDAP